MQNVLVIGINGLIGGFIAGELANNKQINISGFSRSGKGPDNIRIFKGDLKNTESVRQALSSMDQLIIAVSAKAGSCEEIEHRAVVKTARLAEAQGIKRIIYISGASTPSAPRWFEAGTAKKKTEQELATLNTEVVILRPSWLMESLPRFERNGTMSLIGNGTAKIHWLAAADLAGIVHTIVSTENNCSGTYTVLGPEAISLSDAAAGYAKAKGLKGVQKMPLWLGRFISLFAADLKPTVELSRVYEKFIEQREDSALPRPSLRFGEWARSLN